MLDNIIWCWDALHAPGSMDRIPYREMFNNITAATPPHANMFKQYDSGHVHAEDCVYYETNLPCAEPYPYA